MKILFSPSEGKKTGGSNPAISQDSFMFPQLYEKRKEILLRYNNYIKTASDKQLSHLFGIKDISKIQAFKNDIFTQPTLKAVTRYDGVAYDYLDYDTLNQSVKQYIDNNTIIFSNLFGPVLAGDYLPYYKLKQAEKIDGFSVDVFYKQHFSASLDELLQNEPVLDLRAGYYTKFYKPTMSHVTCKFMKNGKSISHWAKAYRGTLLRLIALNNIQSMEEFYELETDGLKIEHIVQKKMQTELVFELS